jgi:hypothetical protein
MMNCKPMCMHIKRSRLAVYGYVRIGTDRQADEGESLGTQQRVIDSYAMMNGLTLDSIFVERRFRVEASWRTPRRRTPPGWTEGRRCGDHLEVGSNVPLRAGRVRSPWAT